jgi:hypothetical protein
MERDYGIGVVPAMNPQVFREIKQLARTKLAAAPQDILASV